MSTSAPLATEPDPTSLLLLAEKLDESKVTPGVLGFLVFAVMGLAVWWLMRSMSRRMDAVKDKQFPAPGADTSATREPTPTTGGTEPKDTEPSDTTPGDPPADPQPPHAKA